MRLFVAIELSSDLRARLVKMQDAVRAVAANLSFTRPENLHLTLKFLGEVPDAQVPQVSGVLASITPLGEFDLKNTASSAFPSAAVCASSAPQSSPRPI